MSIYMFQFPTDDLVPAYCRWQGSFVTPIYPGGSDHLICPVPSHSKFGPFSHEVGLRIKAKGHVTCGPGR